MIKGGSSKWVHETFPEHQAFEWQFLAGALEASRLLQLYPVLATQDSPDAAGAVQRVRGVLDGEAKEDRT